MINRREALKRIAFGTAAIIGSDQLLRAPEAAAAEKKPAELLQLEKHLKSIRAEMNTNLQIVSQTNLFSDIQRITLEEQVSDFEMYFPMYKAAEKRYGIPWYMLWIIHERETEASRNTNPGRNGFRGAMQLAPMHYDEPVIRDAGKGAEFLDDLPQRYSWKSQHQTTDWEEIHRGAAFIRWQMDVRYYPQMPFENAMLAVVQNNYSADGSVRLAKYRELKQIFHPLQPAAKFTTHMQ